MYVPVIAQKTHVPSGGASASSSAAGASESRKLKLVGDKKWQTVIGQHARVDRFKIRRRN